MSRARHNAEGARPVQAGLTAGSVAAIAAVLVNLPLEAPTDTFFNSGSVMVGALAVGAADGALWRLTDGRGTRQWIVFHAVHWVVFAVVAVAALVGETQLERSISYILPLAGIVFGLTGLLTPHLALAGTRLPRWMTAFILLLAIGLGLALAGHGDQESGRLELPPRTSSHVIIDPEIHS